MVTEVEVIEGFHIRLKRGDQPDIVLSAGEVRAAAGMLRAEMLAVVPDEVPAAPCEECGRGCGCPALV